MKKNKGIIVTGGSFKGKNIAVGKESKIERGSSENELNDNLEKKIENGLITNLKNLISKGELKKAVEILLNHFKEEQNKEGLNIMIMHSASLTQIDMQENLGVTSDEQRKVDRAKLTKAILQTIDNQIDRR